MIVLLFGQPASGKTTIADALMLRIFDKKAVRIDGDKWRDVTENKDYSMKGRIANLKSAFDMAIYLEKEGFLPVLSFVAPYQELRTYLDKKSDLYEVYLVYDEDRGRNERFVKDFEEPKHENHIKINTSHYSISECVDKIFNYITSI
jgi:adenylylsulfate kinase